MCVCGGGDGGRGGRGIRAEGFFEVYLIHSEFTTHSGFNGQTIFCKLLIDYLRAEIL